MGSIEDQAMALVVVGAGAVLGEVELLMGELKKNSPTSSIALDQV